MSRHEDFERDGAVCVRGAFSPEQVALVERGIERNLAEPSERAMVASRPDDPGRFFEDFCNWQRIPEFEEFIRESPAAGIAAELMGSQQVRLFHDHLLVKEPGTRQSTPWHQDQPYYNLEGAQNVSMWMPVDPVDRESTVEFVARSHRGPWPMPRTGSAGDCAPDAVGLRRGTLRILWDAQESAGVSDVAGSRSLSADGPFDRRQPSPTGSETGLHARPHNFIHPKESTPL